MTITETYPLHHCVYRNDAVALRELLMDQNMKGLINEVDNHGNTPAHLALMLNRYNCLFVLIQNGCDIFSHNSLGWSPLDEAGLTGNSDIIEKMVIIKWKEIMRRVTEPGGLLDRWSVTTPNLYFKMKVKVKSTIPLLQKVGYKDIVEFYKKDDTARLNFSIGGFDMRGIPKIIRGKMAYIVNKEDGVHKLFLVDYKDKKYQEFFPDIPRWYLTNSLVKKLSTNGLSKFFVDFSGFTFKDRKNILKKNTKTFKLQNGKSYKCYLKYGKKLNLIIRKRYDEANIGESESIINTKFTKGDDYSSLEKFLKKEETNKNTSSTISSNSSSVSYDDSDSDLSSDSDSDSDETSTNVSSVKSLKRKDSKSNAASEFMASLYKSKDKKDANNNTVMYTINKDGETKTFEKKTELEDTLDWEQAYCNKYSSVNEDIIFNLLDGKGDDKNNKHINHMDIVKMNLPKVTEEEYFNPASNKPLHMGRIMNVVERKKAYKHKIKFWMTKESTGFPLKIADVKPLFELITMIIFDQIKTKEATSEMDRAAFFFLTQILVERAESKRAFPIKISIPIYPSIALQLTFLNCSKEPEMFPDDLMEIPKDFQKSDLFFKVVNKSS